MDAYLYRAMLLSPVPTSPSPKYLTTASTCTRKLTLGAIVSFQGAEPAAQSFPETQREVLNHSADCVLVSRVVIPPRWLAVAVVLFGCAVVIGFRLLTVYNVTPGEAGSGPAAWPAASRIKLAQGYHLLLFAHPLCPCTRATVAELSKALLRAVPHNRPPRTDLVLVTQDHSATPQGSPLLELVANIPHASVVTDQGGVEARRFGAKTSGQVFLYKDGQLVFEGGVTGARGHEGDNAAAETLARCLTSSSCSTQKFRVFGCALF